MEVSKRTGSWMQSNCTERLADLHKRFAQLFGRRESRGHSFSYILALLQADGRKSVEPMALPFGPLYLSRQPASPSTWGLKPF